MSATTSPVDEVVDLLRELRLPHMRRQAPEVLATAKARRWEPAEALKALLTEEVAGRQASSINSRRKAAGFPTGKTFDSWAQKCHRSPNPLNAQSPPWNGSAGKRTWSSAARREPANPTCSKRSDAGVNQGCHVSWVQSRNPRSRPPAAPGRRHNEPSHQTDHESRPHLHRRDIGLLPVTTDTAEALYRVVDAAYEKYSIALCSSLHPAGFDELMPKNLANATVDPLLHHAHVVVTTGNSIKAHPSHRRKGGDTTQDLTGQTN